MAKPPRRRELVDIVDFFWASNVSAEAGVERLFPTGQAQVVVDLDSGAGMLVGPRTTHVDVDPRQTSKTIGAALKPGGLEALLGEPADRLIDETVPFACLDRHHDVADEVASLPAGDAIDRLEATLAAMCGDRTVPPPVSAASDALSRGSEPGAVLSTLGLDRRVFVPQFRRSVGFGPKHFHRLRRFQRAVAILRSARPTSLVEIAFRLGYADQAHFTREISGFTGVTPRVLQVSQSDRPNHLAIRK